jgi:hypothetical protein
MLGTPNIKRRVLVAAVLATIVAGTLGACGDGEDRPGNASASGSGSGSASGSGSGTHAMEHGDAEPQFADGEETATVELTLQDYAFVGVPADGAKGENVLFEATVKQGEHELEVLDASGEPVGEIAAFKPDDGEKELALKLEPGTYTLQCLVEEGAKTHKELGMVATLTVT